MTQQSKNILVIDLEATCSEDGSIARADMETIEVGAVIASAQGEVLVEFQRFVRPTIHTTLTPFCLALTHITQADVDGAQEWPAVAAELGAFAQAHGVATWGSWGRYDANQIQSDCARHEIPNPLAGIEHLNLKGLFAKRRDIKQVGLSSALRILKLKFDGQHHRGIDDARNTARLLPYC